MHALFTTLGPHASFLHYECTDGFMVRAARMFGCRPSIGLTRDPSVRHIARRYAHIVVGERFQVDAQFGLVLGAPPYAADILSNGGHLVIAQPFPFGKGGVNGLTFDLHASEELMGLWSRYCALLPYHYVQVWKK